MTELPLSGKHAVVTGGSRGIGAAIARALAGQGAALTLMARDPARLQAQAEALNARAVVVDVADPDSVARAFAQAQQQGGPVDILINNAGVAGSAPFKRTDLAFWQRILSVNLTGTYLCTYAVAPGMAERGYGRIVNIASIAGLVGSPYMTAYCASKHAVIGFTRALAVELAKSGVTVNALCPGYTDTDMVTESAKYVAQKTGRSAEQVTAEFIKNNPLGRLIRPEEVANAALWLVLPGAEAITGQAIALTGGEVQN